MSENPAILGSSNCCEIDICESDTLTSADKRPGAVDGGEMNMLLAGATSDHVSMPLVGVVGNSL